MKYAEIAKPQKGTYQPYFERYIDLVPDENIFRLLEAQLLQMKGLVSEVPSYREDYRYAEGKWTIKEIIGHINDTERIMAYRALSGARGEAQSLPGFDENNYVTNANFNRRTMFDLVHEFGTIREATLSLFRGMTDEELDRTLTANNHITTPRALLFVIAGHVIHHERIIRERYMINQD
jgi:hypothetical protein